MEIVNQVKAMQAYSLSLKQGGVAFVPTMGALHEGHLELIRQASKVTGLPVVVSIFVNPLQFNDPKDFETYPKRLQADRDLLERLPCVECVFAPNFEDLFPLGEDFRVTENRLSTQFEGAHRPGHFAGMLTIVLKLLQIVRPSHAFFGLKDYQQFLLVKALSEEFFLGVKIHGVETVREPSGLALSSRNEKLSPLAREKIAPKLYEILLSKRTDAEAVETLRREGFEVDYVGELAGRRVGAVVLESVRLIDNVPL